MSQTLTIENVIKCYQFSTKKSALLLKGLTENMFSG